MMGIGERDEVKGSTDLTATHRRKTQTSQKMPYQLGGNYNSVMVNHQRQTKRSGSGGRVELRYG